MRMNGNLVFNSDASSEIQHAYIERLASAPTFNAAQKGRIYFNTGSALYYFNDGAAWVPFATGGNAASLQSEVDAIEASLGGLLNANGTYAASALTGSLAGTTSITNALEVLQGLADGLADDLAQEITDRAAAVTAEATARTNADTALGVRIDDVEADLAALDTEVDGVATDLAQEIIDRAAAVTAEATARTNADTALGVRIDDVEADLATEATTRETADTALQANIDLKVSKAGDTMTGQLAMGDNKIIGLAAPTAAGDAVNKNYVDSLLSGLTWEAPVDLIVADHTAIATALTVGMRVANTTDDKIYTVTGAGANGSEATFDAGELLVDGAAFFDRTDETGYVFNGTALVQFTGTGQVTAGIGLVKTGNQIDVNLGAGIAQLPSDEVGIDVLGTGGLFLTIDGTTASSDSAAQIALKLDGSTLTRGAAGVKVSDAVMTTINAAATQSALDAEIARATAAEDAIEADLAAEVTRATAAEDAIADDLADEVTARTTADTALQGEIDALEVKVGKMYFLYEAGSASTSHTVTHNLGQKYCNVTIVDDTDNVVIPQAVVFNSANQLTVTFTSALQCKAIVMGLASA